MLLLLAGCLAIPVVSPPARLTLTGGPGVPIGVEHQEAQPEGVPLVVDLRAGVQPLGVIPDLADRKFDATAGLAMRLDERDPRAGLYGQGSAYIWQEELDPYTRFRLRVYAGADVLAPSTRAPDWDPGFHGGVGFEWAGWVRGQPGFNIDPGNSWVGVYWGEWAVSVVAESGWRRMPEGAEWRAGLGFEVQIPATAGALLIPL